MAHGVIGDGIHDDTRAMQALVSQPHSIVVIPVHTTVKTGPLTLTSHLTLQVDGTLQALDATPSVLNTTNPQFSTRRRRRGPFCRHWTFTIPPKTWGKHGNIKHSCMHKMSLVYALQARESLMDEENCGGTPFEQNFRFCKQDDPISFKWSIRAALKSIPSRFEILPFGRFIPFIVNLCTFIMLPFEQDCMLPMSMVSIQMRVVTY